MTGDDIFYVSETSRKPSFLFVFMYCRVFEAFVLRALCANLSGLGTTRLSLLPREDPEAYLHKQHYETSLPCEDTLVDPIHTGMSILLPPLRQLPGLQGLEALQARIL